MVIFREKEREEEREREKDRERERDVSSSQEFVFFHSRACVLCVQSIVFHKNLFFFKKNKNENKSNVGCFIYNSFSNDYRVQCRR